MRKFILSTVISSTNCNVTRKLRNFREERNYQEAAEKLLRNFREVRNNQETIEKLSGNYREVRNFREIIEKH